MQKINLLFTALYYVYHLQYIINLLCILYLFICTMNKFCTVNKEFTNKILTIQMYNGKL